VPPGDPLYYALKDEIKGLFRIGWCYTMILDGSLVAAFKIKGAKRTHFVISDLLTLEKNNDNKDVVNRIIDQIDETARSIGSMDIELKQINGKAVMYEGNQRMVESFKQRGYKAGGLVLYKAFSAAVQPSGKEVFAEDVCREFLMRRQHLSPQYKAKGKEGILQILHDIGRVHWSDSLAVREDKFDPNDLDELEVRDRKIVHGRFLSESLTMVPTDELIDYYYASRPPSLMLGYDDERILEALTISGPLDEKGLSEKTNQDESSLRRSIENVEKAARMIKVRKSDSLYTPDGWVYDVVDHYLPRGAAEFENRSPKESRKKIVYKFLGANGPVSLKQIEEWSHIELTEVKYTLSELEAEGKITSNVYIEGVSGRRYVRKEDLPELRMLEEQYLSQKLSNGSPFYVTLPDSDPVVKTWKDELLARFTIGLIELGADYYTLTLKSGTPVAAMQLHYEMNTLRIHDIEILDASNEEVVEAVIKEIERTAKESRKLEIQIEHISSRSVTDKLNRQQLEKFMKEGFKVTKDILHRKLGS
jgi:hypothetical protein